MLKNSCIAPREDKLTGTGTETAAWTGAHSRNKFIRTCAILFLFIALKAVGNLSLAWGMKHTRTVSASPLLYLRAIPHPLVALGVVMLILALLTRMALFSLANLSFVLPVTAIGYVLAASLGKVFLHENVTPQRWLGTLLIFAGAALVGSTSPSTIEPAEKLK